MDEEQAAAAAASTEEEPGGSVNNDDESSIVEAAVVIDDDDNNNNEQNSIPRRELDMEERGTIVYALPLPEQGNHRHGKSSTNTCSTNSTATSADEPKTAVVLQVLPGSDEEETAATAPFDSTDSLPTVIDLTWQAWTTRRRTHATASRGQKFCLLIFPLILIAGIAFVAYAALQNKTSAVDEDSGDNLLGDHTANSTVIPTLAP